MKSIKAITAVEAQAVNHPPAVPKQLATKLKEWLQTTAALGTKKGSSATTTPKKPFY